MAELIQHIIERRALAGQHPQRPAEIIEWLLTEAATRGWNRQPRPFIWGGKHTVRRCRSRQRRLSSVALALVLAARSGGAKPYLINGYKQAK